MKSMTYLVVFLFFVITLGSYALLTNTEKAYAAILYKEPACGCCGEYVKYLQGKGLALKVVNTQSLDDLKQEHQVPPSMESCHTIVMGRYFIEGHIPFEAIEKLISEQPDIDGIAVPGMPPGSPGMPGIKSGEFIVYAIRNKVPWEYMRI